MALQITVNTAGPDSRCAVDTSLLAQRYADVEAMIMDGLPDEGDRISAMQVNAAYYRRENASYLEKRREETPDDFNDRPKRVVYLVSHAVDTLGRKLYSPGPSRTFRPDGPAAEVLKTAYARAGADVVLASANRWAILNDVAAIQVSCTGRPEDPVRLYVYGGQEFAAYCSPDEPTRPWCVVTIAVESAGSGRKRRVYTSWTVDAIRVYKTRPYSQFDTAGCVRAYLETAERNAYGCIPFAFVHNAPPVDRFWGGGIGDPLRQANAEIDRELSELSQQIQLFNCPDMFARNVPTSFLYLKRPGRPQILPNVQAALEGDATGLVPEVFYVQPVLNIESTWSDVEKQTNRVFSDLDVPLQAVRDGYGAPTSGLQVMAESIPLLDYLADRKLMIVPVDLELATTILRCVGNFHGKPDLVKAAATLEMDVVWPESQLPVPTPEANAEDEFELQNGLASPIQVLMRRRGMTHAQAVEYARSIAEDNKLWVGLFPGADPRAVAPAPTSPDTEGDATAPLSRVDPGSQGEEDSEPI